MPDESVGNGEIGLVGRGRRQAFERFGNAGDRQGLFRPSPATTAG
jgi:hypothetical protein